MTYARIFRIANGLLFTLICLLFASRSTHAIHLYQDSAPTPFLSSVYYGTESVWKVFDHHYPLFGGDGDDNDWVVHYDGTRYDPEIPAEYGYDSHIGIDYSLEYEPVLAAAEGTVSFAGWSNPSNHQAMYGLHVRMVATANQDYKMWYIVA